MEDKLRARLGLSADTVFKRSFDGQLLGQTWETPFIDVPDGVIDTAAIDTMIANFHVGYEARNVDRFEQIPVQGVTFRIRAEVPTEKVRFPSLPDRGDTPLAPIGETTLRYLGAGDHVAQIYERRTLCAGDVINGPAIVREPLSTTHIGQGQVGTIGRHGEIVITQV
jgi:N-methylhydantoinase A